jgi:hypothetical protein
VLNTPSAHRVHHAANLDYLDANYGGVLIVFDRLFGTYRAEREDLPCRYGLVEPMRGHNPLRIEFQQWLALGHDLLRARSLRAFFGLLAMPPGWNPHGAGHTTAELRARAGAASAASAAPMASAGATFAAPPAAQFAAAEARTHTSGPAVLPLGALDGPTP